MTDNNTTPDPLDPEPTPAGPDPLEGIDDKLDPKAEVMSAWTLTLCRGLDEFWSTQPDTRVFDLWRHGLGFFTITADGPRGMSVDFVRAKLEVTDARDDGDLDGGYI